MNNTEGEIQLSEEQQFVVDKITNSNDNFLVLGKGGTGKSVIINKSKSMCNRLVVVAPTGIASQNVGGSTIHSFFGINIQGKLNDISHNYDKQASLRMVNKIIVDEAGMIPHYIFSLMDLRLRQINQNEKPFGGVQIILFGDLYQLAPVIKAGDEKFGDMEFFFESPSFEKGNFRYYELTKSFRQNDEGFIGILDRMREGTITDEDINVLNSRVITREQYKELPDDIIYLSTRNNVADDINQRRLNKIDSPKKTYYGIISGIFPDNVLPVPQEIDLKIGTHVMTRVNKDDYNNGSIGIVIDMQSDGVVIDFGTHKSYVCSHEYEITSNKGTKLGTYSQVPVTLAWAISIHKSQGLTFSHLVIDLSQGSFASGQTYVAFSRARTLEGIFLMSPVTKKDIIVSPKIKNFISYMRNNARY